MHIIFSILDLEIDSILFYDNADVFYFTWLNYMIVL